MDRTEHETHFFRAGRCAAPRGFGDQQFGPDSWGFQRRRLLESNVGQARAADGRRIYILEVDSRIQHGRLIVDWTASDRLHPRAAIEELAESYLVSIEQIVAAATSGESANSPTDFPLADLDAAEMENLAGMLEDIDDDG